MSSERARNTRRQILRAAIERLEGRQLFCATHALAGSAVKAALTGLSSLTIDDPAGGAETVIAGTRQGTLTVGPPTSSTLSSLEPVGAAPGQVNGSAIFGGGIYGDAAANFTARADGLPLLSSDPGAPFTVFLDFDGWTGNGFSGPETWSPYSTDGNPAVFGTTEAAAIAEAWRRTSCWTAGPVAGSTRRCGTSRPSSSGWSGPCPARRLPRKRRKRPP